MHYYYYYHRNESKITVQNAHDAQYKCLQVVFSWKVKLIDNILLR